MCPLYFDSPSCHRPVLTQNVMDEESSQSTHLMNMSRRQTVDSNISTSDCVILGAYDSAPKPLCFHFWHGHRCRERPAASL